MQTTQAPAGNLAESPPPQPDTLFIDLDGTEEVVSSLIDRGVIEYVRVTSWPAYENLLFTLIKAKKHYSTIIVDSVSALVHYTKVAVEDDKSPVLEAGVPKITANLSKFKLTQPEHGSVAGIVTRAVDYIERSKLADHVIVLGHDSEEYRGEEDTDARGKRIEVRVPTGRTIPRMTPALWKYVEPMTNVLARYSVAGTRGQSRDGTTYQAGDRILRLKENADYVAKCRVRDDLPEAPEILVNPTMFDLMKVCGKLPARFVLYGPAGSGKTYFVTSHLRVKNNTTTKKDNK